MPMPGTVRIYFDRSHLTLCLPNFFALASTMDQIHVVMKTLKQRSYQNETAFETLDYFFPMWKSDLDANLAYAAAGQETAELAMGEFESEVACFGSKLSRNLEKKLQKKKQDLKISIDGVKHAKNALKRYDSTIKAYKEVKDHINPLNRQRRTTKAQKIQGIKGD